MLHVLIDYVHMGLIDTALRTTARSDFAGGLFPSLLIRAPGYKPFSLVIDYGPHYAMTQQYSEHSDQLTPAIAVWTGGPTTKRNYAFVITRVIETQIQIGRVFIYSANTSPISARCRYQIPTRRV